MAETEVGGCGGGDRDAGRHDAVRCVPTYAFIEAEATFRRRQRRRREDATSGSGCRVDRSSGSRLTVRVEAERE